MSLKRKLSLSDDYIHIKAEESINDIVSCLLDNVVSLDSLSSSSSIENPIISSNSSESRHNINS